MKNCKKLIKVNVLYSGKIKKTDKRKFQEDPKLIARFDKELKDLIMMKS